MTQTRNIRWISAGILALVLMFAAVACQPAVETAQPSLPPSATPVPEADTSPLPPPAAEVPAGAGTTQPTAALSTPTAAAPRPTLPGAGDAPIGTAPASMPHRDLIGPSPEAEKVIVLTQKDLAQRLSISEEVILVQSIEAVTWPDASLGCPVAGQAYAQVLTPGFRMILEVDGQAYEYHTGPSSTILLCEESDTGEAPAGKPDGSVQDGWPNQPVGNDNEVVPPTLKP